MSTIACQECGRVNPPEARYCHHDGAALDGAAGRGPVAGGSQPFQRPLVLPSGQVCYSFNELVLLCEADWNEAMTFLKKGYFQQFFKGLGRSDLAEVAEQAARAPDLHLSLDELLNRIPNSVRTPARLQVQPRELNLGELARGAYRSFTVQIENRGTGLLHGSVSCPDTPWLAIGDGAGVPQKTFRCRDKFAMPIQVVGKALRANAQSQRGTLLVESNGGDVEIAVEVLVPVKPFFGGVLTGAKSPREVVENARAAPQAAGALFACGAVAAWYEANGWTYPVHGPSASGPGAAQQFLEALGIIPPPKVEISTRSLSFQGMPGGAAEEVVVLQSADDRPVFALALSSDPWLTTGKALLDGRVARIPVRVPVVPHAPGQTLRGRVEVTANGNQRFTVEVALSVRGAVALPPPLPPVAFAPRGPGVPPPLPWELPARRPRKWLLWVAAAVLAAGAAAPLVYLAYH